MDARTVSQLLLLVALGSLIAACSGGGGGEGAEISAPALSDDLALPGQILSISHATIQADDIVEVVFQTGDAQPTAADTDETAVVIPILGIARADGVVDVAVPPFFDADGLPAVRDVRVLVNDIPSVSILHVEGLPELPVDTRGAVLAAFLSAAIDYYSNALDNFDTVADQLAGNLVPTEAKVAVEALLQDLQVQLLEIEVNGTHTVVIDGASITLTQRELALVDHWLLLSLVSINTSADLVTGNTTVAVQTSPAERLRENWRQVVKRIEQEDDVAQFLDGLIVGSLNDGKEAFMTHAPYVFGFLSLATAGAGALGDKALGIAASTSNMAAAQFSALLSTINGYLADQNTDSFLGDDRDGFSAGQEALSQGVRLGTAYLGTEPDRLGKLAGLINTALSVKDMLTAAQVSLCDVLGSPALLCADDGAPPGTFVLVSYDNFDGTRKQQVPPGPSLDPQEADIRISGNLAFPTISWEGDGIHVLVEHSNHPSGQPSSVYGIRSMQDTNFALIPFNSPVRYGNYNIPDTQVAEGFPASSPALQADGVYVISVQRSDFESAVIIIGFR